jgi:hypothetical protein
MQTLLLNGPCGSAIPADAKPNSSRRDHSAGLNRVRTDFVDITINVNGWLPSDATVCGARDASDVDVGEKHRPI